MTERDQVAVARPQNANLMAACCAKDHTGRPSELKQLRNHRAVVGPRLRNALRIMTASRMRMAATKGFSCSQTRMLTQPACSSRVSVSSSRAMFPATLSAQNLAFVAATV